MSANRNNVVTNAECESARARAIREFEFQNGLIVSEPESNDDPNGYAAERAEYRRIGYGF